MNARRHFSQLGIALLWIAAIDAHAANFTVDSLLRRSPFMPATSAPQPQQQQNNAARLEFRGIFTLGGSASFNVFDTTNQNSVWLRLGQSEQGITVTAYDPNTETITVLNEGNSRQIKLKEAQIITLNIQETPRPQATPVGNPAAEIANGTEASAEQLRERRQRVVEELRRRRSLRQAAQQQRDQEQQQIKAP